MINLGKFFLLLALLVVPAWAEFTAKISDTRINQGDQIVLTLTSTKSSELPVLNEIGGNAIENSGREESRSFINGKMSGIYKIKYIFTPMKSFTVPSYEMKEDGQTVRTKPIKVTVKPYSFDKDDNDLVLKVRTSKKNVIVGESFVVSLTYKQKSHLDVVDRRLTPPSGKHLWVDKDPIQSTSSANGYDQVRLDYIFTAQKAGKLVINPANIKVAERSYGRDAWGRLIQRPRYKTVFSDDIIINAIALPKGVENVGNFKMEVSVDKKQSNEKDAINLMIKIEGEGNVADIKAFSLSPENVLVYDEKPQHTNSLENGKYKGSFVQKFALVADTNYTIPSFEFSFYNPKSKKIKRLHSKPIKITINRTQTAQRLSKVQIEKADDKDSSPVVYANAVRVWWEYLLAGLIGLIL
ncbi:MAG: BatD family protein, partial [Thiovulaceae bacterium]|nr:BatD family protein [Sulfurimonadaceae bacterium]